MKKFDYDKFIKTSSKVAVLCRNSKEAEEFGRQMNIRRQYTVLNKPYYEDYEDCNHWVRWWEKGGLVFTNDGHFGLLHEYSLLQGYTVYDFTTGEVVDWKRGTKRPNDYCYHKDVIDYKDYDFENQLYHVSYYRNEPELRTKFMDIKYDVIGYIDNFNPADKIAIRDKNNLLYCIDYKMITLIEPIKGENDGRC